MPENAHLNGCFDEIDVNFMSEKQHRSCFSDHSPSYGISLSEHYLHLTPNVQTTPQLIQPRLL